MKKRRVDEVRKAIENDNRQREQELLEYKGMILTTRAGQLLKAGKSFIVVEPDEPYYMETYKAIRLNAMARGTWTSRCEADFQQALQAWASQVPVKMGGVR